MVRRSWKIEMTASERGRGLVFFLLYLLVLPKVNAWAQRLFLGDAEELPAEAMILYYGALFLMVLLLFWSFVKSEFYTLLDCVPENLYAILVGLAAALLGRRLMELVPFPLSDPILPQYIQEFHAAPVPTLVLILLLIPLVEETLFRGLVFGNLRQYSRPLAYGVSVVLYALSLVWRYALSTGDLRYLWLAFFYLPPAFAFTWCYDWGGSVWGSALLHAGYNGFLLALNLR